MIQPLVERIEKTFVILQGLNTLVCEQRDELFNLAIHLMERMNIEGPLVEDDVQTFAAALSENPCVKQEKLIEAVDEAGEYVQMEMDKMKADEKEICITLLLTQLQLSHSKLLQG